MVGYVANTIIYVTNQVGSVDCTVGYVANIVGSVSNQVGSVVNIVGSVTNQVGSVEKIIGCVANVLIYVANQNKHVSFLCFSLFLFSKCLINCIVIKQSIMRKQRLYTDRNCITTRIE